MKLFSAAILLSFLLSCSGSLDEIDSISNTSETGDGYIEVPPMGRAAILNDDELHKAIKKAENGDGEAAYRLFAHYGIGTGNTELAENYLNLAIKLGYPVALYNKAVEMWEMYNNKFYKGSSIDKEEIRSLVERAVAAGHPDTRGLLHALQEDQTDVTD